MSEEKTGFQYSVTIDQVGAERAGLPDDIDDRHLAIIAMCEKYFHWKGCPQMGSGKNTYYLLEWTTVQTRLIRFRMTSRSVIKRLIARLVEVELLQPYPDNQRLGQSWVRFGEKYAEMQNLNPCQKRTPRVKSDTPPSQIWDGPRVKSDTPPVSNLTQYNEYNSELTDDDNDEAAPSPTSSWKKHLLADAAFADLIGYTYKMPPTEMSAKLEEFILQKRGLGKTNTGYSDFKNNFFHWLRKNAAANAAQHANAGKTRKHENLIDEQQARRVLARLSGEEGQ